MLEIIKNWTNSNSGFLALLLFIAGLCISLLLWLLRKTKKNIESGSNFNLEIIETPTLCSSYHIRYAEFGKDIHSTAFLIYLIIKNNGEKPTQIGKIKVAYKSSGLDTPESWYWLKDEVLLMDDFVMPIGDKVKVFPFLRQKNALMNNEPKTFLAPREEVNGLVYFEQDESIGEMYPYMDPDNKVQTKIVVSDSLGNESEIEHRVNKVLIEAVRKHCPSFGCTKQSADNYG